MKLSLRFLIFLVPLALFAAGCGGTSGPRSVPSNAVAIVDEQPVTKAEYDHVVDQIRASYKQQKAPFPKAGSQAYRSQVRDRALQALVQRDEIEQRAQELGVKVGDSEVAARLKKYKKQYFGGSDAIYHKQLKAYGYTEEDFRTQLRLQLESQKLYDKVTKDVKVTDAEVKSYYDSHKSLYSQPETRDVRHILVNSKPLADKIYTQLKSGGDFAALAKKYSKDTSSAAQGGKLCVAHGQSSNASCFQTVAEFDKAAFTLGTGAISKPVHTQYGWHVIQAISPIRKASQQPLSAVKETIRQQRLQEKKTTAINDWVKSLQKDFCAGKIGYQTGYEPVTDPCVAVTTSVSTQSATTP
jgi:parvulin-like peptidyl-prolyl isomerase